MEGPVNGFCSNILTFQFSLPCSMNDGIRFLLFSLWEQPEKGLFQSLAFNSEPCMQDKTGEWGFSYSL